MRKICVYIQVTDREAMEIIDKIVNDFACFIFWELSDRSYWEVTISCRQEDAGRVETRLASLV